MINKIKPPLKPPLPPPPPCGQHLGDWNFNFYWIKIDNNIINRFKATMIGIGKKSFFFMLLVEIQLFSYVKYISKLIKTNVSIYQNKIKKKRNRITTKQNKNKKNRKSLLLIFCLYVFWFVLFLFFNDVFVVIFCLHILK